MQAHVVAGRLARERNHNAAAAAASRWEAGSVSSSGSGRKRYDAKLKVSIFAAMLEGKHELEELAQIHGPHLEVLHRWRDEWVQLYWQEERVDRHAQADLLKERNRLRSKLKRIKGERDFFAQVWPGWKSRTKSLFDPSHALPLNGRGFLAHL